MEGEDFARLVRRVRVQPPGARRSVSRSATRALDVLELFGEVRHPLRAVEVASALGLHPSSVNQLLKTMVESAHLTFDAHFKTYLPSPRLWQFGAWMAGNYGNIDPFRDLLSELHRATGIVATLTTPNDLWMQVLDVAGSEPAASAVERGLRTSIFGSVIGAAHLSTLPSAEIERLAGRARLSADDASAVVSRADGVRRAGIASGPSNGGEHWSVAIPLPRHLAPPPLVVGLAGPAPAVAPQTDVFAEALRSGLAHWIEARALSHAGRPLAR